MVELKLFFSLGGLERGTNERPGIWSCDLWANESLEINFTGRGQTHGQTDIATTRLNWPRADSLKNI